MLFIYWKPNKNNNNNKMQLKWSTVLIQVWKCRSNIRYLRHKQKTLVIDSRYHRYTISKGLIVSVLPMYKQCNLCMSTVVTRRVHAADRHSVKWNEVIQSSMISMRHLNWKFEHWFDCTYNYDYKIRNIHTSFLPMNRMLRPCELLEQAWYDGAMVVVVVMVKVFFQAVVHWINRGKCGSRLEHLPETLETLTLKTLRFSK